MAHEKVVVALFRIRDANESEKTLPIGFKISENAIPNEVKPDRLHPANLCQIQITGYKAVPAMVVCIGDDSSEIITLYTAFCERMKAKKIPSLVNKITHWLSVSKIVLIQQSNTKMQSITMKEFDTFIAYAEGLSKLEKRTKEKGISSKGKRPQSIFDGSSSSMETTGNQNMTKTSSGYITDANISTVSKREVSNIQDLGSKTNLIDSTMERIHKFQILADGLSSFDSNRSLFIEASHIYMDLAKYVQNIEKKIGSNKVENLDSGIKYSCEMTIIDEDDGTRESGNTTYIEGLLPVRTSKYKKAMASLSADIQDRQPSNVITIIAKKCFPDHWVTGVTLKGQGGKKSLLQIWNHEDPLSCPATGSYSKQLGMERFQALINHTLRKCGRKSYDLSMEKHLGSALAKAIHYKSTKVNSARGWDQLESSDDDAIYTSDKEADKEDYEDADDYRLPKQKNRKFQSPVLSSQRTRNSESFNMRNSPKLAAKASKSISPMVSMVYDLSPTHESEKDENHTKGIEGDGYGNKEDESSIFEVDEEEDNDVQPLKENVARNEQEKKKRQDISESEKTESNLNMKSQDEESFGFDDDEDDFLRDIKIDDDQGALFPGPTSSSDEETNNSGTKNPESKEDDKREKGLLKDQDSSKEKSNILTSTPNKDNIHTLSFRCSPIPEKSQLNTEVSASIGSRSSISKEKVDTSKKGELDSYFPKRKLGLSLDESSASKKSKSFEKEKEKSEEPCASAAQQESAKIDPMTLAFLSNPANAALLKQLMAQNQQKEGKKDLLSSQN